jgi:hypothetical protein
VGEHRIASHRTVSDECMYACMVWCVMVMVMVFVCCSRTRHVSRSLNQNDYIILDKSSGGYELLPLSSSSVDMSGRLIEGEIDFNNSNSSSYMPSTAASSRVGRQFQAEVPDEPENRHYAYQDDAPDGNTITHDH